jgi:hypothetical protein
LSSSSSRCPELALFLVIGAGYWIGSFTFGEFSGRDRNVEELLVVLDLLPARSDVGRIRTRSGTSCSRLRHDHRGRHGELTSQEVRAIKA